MVRSYVSIFVYLLHNIFQKYNSYTSTQVGIKFYIFYDQKCQINNYQCICLGLLKKSFYLSFLSS